MCIVQFKSGTIFQQFQRNEHVRFVLSLRNLQSRSVNVQYCRYVRRWEVFNQDLSHFDTPKVIRMTRIFEDCHAFDQDLSRFDTAKVIFYMSWMFYNATKFNGSLESFGTSNVLQFMDGTLHGTIFC
mmetsp:Transcript_29300/g.70649  ORF Transcript_29300/g.70649 Transcript_29300/m.70649 type:complete len:127 (+) Transcript_29300:1421-1801(+)